MAGRLDPPRRPGRPPTTASSVDADPALLDAVAAALIGIRGAKSQAKVSMRAPLARVEVTGPAALVEAAASPPTTSAAPATSRATWSSPPPTPPRSRWSAELAEVP